MAVKFWISTSSTSFNTAANWSDGIAPANNDTLIFNSLGTANVQTNLSTTLTGLTIVVEQSFAGQIGVLSGSTATYLTINGGTLYVGQNTGQGEPSGSTLIMVDFGASNSGNAGIVYVFDSASTSANSYYPPVLIRNSSTFVTPPITTVTQTGGSVGLAALPGDTTGSNKFSLFISRADSASIKPSVLPTAYIGRSATVNNISAETGTIYDRITTAHTSIALSGDAKMLYDGTVNLTQADIYTGAELIDRGTAATHTTINVDGGTYRRANVDTLTITALNLYSGATFDVNVIPGIVTFVTTSTLVKCGMQDVKISGPPGFKI